MDDLKKYLRRIQDVEVAVIGDFCLDAYYLIDWSHSEISLETGQATRPVKQLKFSLGGASNVTNNLIDLGVRNVYAIGVVGDDCFGKELSSLLDKKRINRDYLLTQHKQWATHVYTKIIDGNEELERFDFGTFNRLSKQTACRLIESIRALAQRVHYFVINQQIKMGIHTSFFREELRKLMAEYPDVTFIADCRDYNTEYPDAIHKLNDIEGAKLCGMKDPETPAREQAETVIKALFDRWRKPVFLTRGSRGCLVYDGTGRIDYVPGFNITSKIDTVGAGDSMLAGIIASLAGGFSLLEAAELGNMVAGVTIQKLFQTGTASPDEIEAFAEQANVALYPEIAESVRLARYHEGSEIEIITGRKSSGNYAFAVFDHDGTLSTLRQGWEKTMMPVMLKAILGNRYDKVSPAVFEQVRETIKSYIDKTTGIQTLSQMKGLVKMVEEHGYVPKSEILDEFGYKAQYNEALMEVVQGRMDKVQKGELQLEDVTVKGAISLLEFLRERGVTLFLASGTDEEDVIRETELLGYKDYFNGGIWGAQNNLAHEPKKVVLENILNEIGRQHAGRIITFGDGPVEIRETAKAGGFTVGVASDEVQRFGLNEVKRKRLILAGADIIIPDYSQLEILKTFIFR